MTFIRRSRPSLLPSVKVRLVHVGSGVWARNICYPAEQRILLHYSSNYLVGAFRYFTLVIKQTGRESEKFHNISAVFWCRWGTAVCEGFSSVDFPSQWSGIEAAAAADGGGGGGGVGGGSGWRQNFLSASLHPSALRNN